MQRRIFGIETEFGVTCTFHGQRRLSPDEVARYLFRRVVSWGRSSNVFLRNGSRLYLDVGSHPEYATAECDDLSELVVHDKAGERILEGLLVDAEQRLAGEGVTSATTRSRPIINTRDEPHADAERYRRLHVIVGDSNMNETTTLLKVAVTDLVLRMIEAGVPIRDMTLENPIRAIREISHDMTGRRKVRLANGKEMSALEIQSEYHSRAAEFVDREGFGPVHRQMLELWGRVLQAVDTRGPSLIDRGVDR